MCWKWGSVESSHIFPCACLLHEKKAVGKAPVGVHDTEVHSDLKGSSHWSVTPGKFKVGIQFFSFQFTWSRWEELQGGIVCLSLGTKKRAKGDNCERRRKWQALGNGEEKCFSECLGPVKISHIYLTIFTSTVSGKENRDRTVPMAHTQCQPRILGNIYSLQSDGDARCSSGVCKHRKWSALLMLGIHLGGSVWTWDAASEQWGSQLPCLCSGNKFVRPEW